MNLQQLRYVREVARCGLNVSDAAESLYTSQPGVSKQIRLLEEELGVEIFVRRGKRIVEVTEPGRQVLAIAERLLRDIDNLKQVGNEFSDQATGRLAIATTHTQARYALPRVIQQFAQRYPGVRLSLRQGSPTEICRYVIAGEADIAIATEAIEHYEELVMLPCYQWNRCILVPRDHPLTRAGPLTLAAIARHPIVTYDTAFTGRSQINAAFAAAGLAVTVVLSALDADVIKTYVELGMGVGIVAEMAFDPARDAGLVALPARHLFAPSTTRLAIRRGAFLRGYVYDFIARFAPALDRRTVDAALEAAR